MELSFSKPFAEMRYHEFVYTTAPSIPFTHCFTTRLGGVSEDYLDSLNLGENRGDKPQTYDPGSSGPEDELMLMHRDGRRWREIRE